MSYARMLYEIEAQWVRLENKYIKFTDQVDPQTRLSIEPFANVINQVSRCFRRILEGNEKREEMIELHCDRRHALTLSKHEEYHEISEQLKTDIRSYFLVYKTCLNSLTILIQKSVVLEKVKGLRFRSFGSLVASAKRVQFKDNKYERLRKILATMGSEIDEQVLSYRDKVIEHPGRLRKGGLISNKEGVPRIYHLRREEKISIDTVPDTSHKDNGIECIVLATGENEKLVLFHISPDPNLKPDASVKKGQLLGYVYDSTGSHFEKYDSHSHAFSTPGIKFSPDEMFGGDKDSIIESPDPLEAMLKLGRLLEEVFIALSSVNSKIDPN